MGNAASSASREIVKKTGKAVASKTSSAAGAAAAAAAAAAAPRPPPLGRPFADAPDVIEDSEAPLRQRQQEEARALAQPEASFTTLQQQQKQQQQQQSAARLTQPPQPDANTGFYRGQISDPRDVAQEKFLVHQSGESKDASQELAPDLLQFLKDAGPLEKKLNRKLTSPRLIKELEQDGETSEKRHRMETAGERKQTEMRLVEGIEGHSTTRTTNFFTSRIGEDDDEQDLQDFGFIDLELYDLLRRCELAAKANQDAKDVTTMENVVTSFYRETRGEQLEAAGFTQEQQNEQQQLLKNTAEYLELPIVTKDEDANYVGLDRKELQREFAHQKLDIVDESRVKLVLADLVDMQRKEITRMR